MVISGGYKRIAISYPSDLVGDQQNYAYILNGNSLKRLPIDNRIKINAACQIGNQLYFGGDFSGSIGVMNLDTNVIRLSETNAIQGQVTSLICLSNRVIVGGQFITTINTFNLAILDLDFNLLQFDGLNGAVQHLTTLDQGNILVRGNFTNSDKSSQYSYIQPFMVQSMTMEGEALDINQIICGNKDKSLRISGNKIIRVKLFHPQQIISIRLSLDNVAKIQILDDNNGKALQIQSSQSSCDANVCQIRSGFGEISIKTSQFLQSFQILINTESSALLKNIQLITPGQLIPFNRESFENVCTRQNSIPSKIQSNGQWLSQDYTRVQTIKKSKDDSMIQMDLNLPQDMYEIYLPITSCLVQYDCFKRIEISVQIQIDGQSTKVLDIDQKSNVNQMILLYQGRIKDQISVRIYPKDTQSNLANMIIIAEGIVIRSLKTFNGSAILSTLTTPPMLTPLAFGRDDYQNIDFLQTSDLKYLSNVYKGFKKTALRYANSLLVGGQNGVNKISSDGSLTSSGLNINGSITKLAASNQNLYVFGDIKKAMVKELNGYLYNQKLVVQLGQNSDFLQSPIYLKDNPNSINSLDSGILLSASESLYSQSSGLYVIEDDQITPLLPPNTQYDYNITASTNVFETVYFAANGNIVQIQNGKQRVLLQYSGKVEQMSSNGVSLILTGSISIKPGKQYNLINIDMLTMNVQDQLSIKSVKLIYPYKNGFLLVGNFGSNYANCVQIGFYNGFDLVPILNQKSGFLGIIKTLSINGEWIYVGGNQLSPIGFSTNEKSGLFRFQLNDPSSLNSYRSVDQLQDIYVQNGILYALTQPSSQEFQLFKITESKIILQNQKGQISGLATNVLIDSQENIFIFGQLKVNDRYKCTGAKFDGKTWSPYLIGDGQIQGMNQRPTIMLLQSVQIGEQFAWWKIFLIVFGILLGLIIISFILLRLRKDSKESEQRFYKSSLDKDLPQTPKSSKALPFNFVNYSDFGDDSTCGDSLQISVRESDDTPLGSIMEEDIADFAVPSFLNDSQDAQSISSRETSYIGELPQRFKQVKNSLLIKQNSELTSVTLQSYGSDTQESISLKSSNSDLDLVTVEPKDNGQTVLSQNEKQLPFITTSLANRRTSSLASKSPQSPKLRNEIIYD